MRNESGRSMVEMLGVLAIIGVLSVGGIAGYTMAMNKYKANEILAAAAQCAMLARSANAGEGVKDADNKTCADLGVTGLETDSIITVSGETYSIPTGVDNDADDGVCKAIKGITGSTNCSTFTWS